MFGFNEKSNAQLLFLESIERGYPQGDEDGLQEVLSPVRDKLGRQGCWAPWMEERRLLRQGLQIPVLDASNVPPVDTGVGHLTQFMFMAFRYNWN